MISHLKEIYQELRSKVISLFKIANFCCTEGCRTKKWGVVIVKLYDYMLRCLKVPVGVGGVGVLMAIMSSQLCRMFKASK